VLEAVAVAGSALEHAHAELRRDVDVVTEAVCQDGEALRFASEDLRGTYEVVLDAVRQNGEALRFASDELREDSDLALEAVRSSGFALRYVPAGLRNADGRKVYEDVALEAVQQTWEAVEFAVALNPEAMLEAVRQDWRAILHLLARKPPPDAALLTELAAANPGVLRAGPLRSSRDVALAAVRHDGLALRHASATLRADRALVAEALRQHPDALWQAAPALQRDPELLEARRESLGCGAPAE